MIFFEFYFSGLSNKIMRKYLITGDWSQSTPYHICPVAYVDVSKIAGLVANNVDTDQTPRSVALIWVYTVCSGLSKYLR